ncbi:MAG: glycosyltransferase family 4 protein [Bacteroidota bacterium]
MKIGMILDKSFPPDPRVENEADTLIRAGHEVYLYCFDYSGTQAQQEDIYGIQVWRARMPKHIYSLSALAYTIPYYHWFLEKSLKKFVEENDIEALHVHDMQVARTVFKLNKAWRLPLVLDLHENRPEIMKYYAHVNSLQGKLLVSPKRWKKFEYQYIKQADKVIVVTEEAKQYYLKELTTNPEKFYVVPNSIRKSFYNNYQRSEDIIERYRANFTVLYLGDTGLRRGVRETINALAHLIPKIPNIRMVFVGNSKTDHVLKSLVVRNQWENHVDLMGWQDFQLFQSYILACDVGISPIHRNIHHDTTFANKIFQYLAFGKPVIVSDCPAQQNLIEQYQCGLVFKNQSVEGIAEKITQLYEDQTLYKQLSENAKKAIETHLNWEILSKELVQLYEQLDQK